MPSLPIGMFAALLLVAAAPVGEAALSERELMDVFSRLGLTVDTNSLERPMAEALLRAIDPRGDILSAAEFGRFDKGPTIETSESWPEALFYIKFGGMRAGGPSNIASNLNDKLKRKPSGLILDLRDAAGHSLETTDAVLGMFVEPGTPLYAIRNGTGNTGTTNKAAPSDIRLDGITCAVLVNEETRDASELLAAVLGGLPNVIVLGWRTRGDAGLRTPVELSSGERILVASRWAVPANGGEYHGKGVIPDIALTSSSLPSSPVPPPIPGYTREPSGRALAAAKLRERIDGDSALLRACDLLLGLKAIRKTTNAWVPDPSPGPEKSP